MTHRETHLKQLSVLDFMLLDLGLYLNNNPTDERAIALHKQASDDAAKLRKLYEQNHGPLCNRTNNDQNEWQWINSPWPWETDANYNI
ncbi:MAG: spore coat protein CotJB [Defluviitaleaceae bacterium]|nr:spore coat protein CotJB [Defluviitaleaceae bacterium]